MLAHCHLDNMDTNLVEIARLMAGNVEPAIPFPVQIGLIVLGFGLGIAIWFRLGVIQKLLADT